MTSNATPSDTLRNTVRAGVRDLPGVWWWFLSLGVLWTLFGTYMLSYRVGSLARGGRPKRPSRGSVRNRR